ncbi:MAG: hypothetical protein QXV17_08725 [Candidatus Micrarchaeaceae archaeon]
MISKDLKTRLYQILVENKDKCITMNGRPEITRTVALAMQGAIVEYVAEKQGSILYKKEVLNFSPPVVKASVIIDVDNGRFQFEAIGSSDEDDIKRDKRVYHDTIATAETRALKRLIEEIAGDDFVNVVLVKHSNNNMNMNNNINRQENKRLATEKQLSYIAGLAKNTGIRISTAMEKAGFTNVTEDAYKHMSYDDAVKLIDFYLNYKKNTVNKEM